MGLDTTYLGRIVNPTTQFVETNYIDMSRGHMTYPNMIFYCTHVEEQGVNSTCSFFTFKLTIGIVQNLTCHLTTVVPLAGSSKKKIEKIKM